MTIKKRVLSFLLSVCTVASMVTVPAAASTGFSDVGDRTTAAAVESLRLMGVLDGYSDGSFRPEANLTRAQFCKMAVYAMVGEDQLGQYRTVTVFQDVKPSYWAAPYINMASKGKKIIAGYPNGKFMPGNTVTYGQAVTILMRMLGYKDEDMGGIWPDGYLASASTVHLTDGVTSIGTAPLTRGQAAILFTNLLRCDKKDGGTFAASVSGSVVEGAMLTNSKATAADGSETAMQLGNGAVYSMANKKPSTGILNGMKGILMLDKQGKVITFVPQTSGTSRTVTFASATASKLTTTTGESLAINGTTSMFVNGEEKTWSTGYTWLNPGISLTLYVGGSGGVEYIFAGSGTAATAAVIVYNRGSTAGFNSLTGDGTNYGIFKNGASATAGDLRPNDVATYSAATNSIRVCDTRITGIFENATPNIANPTSVTVLGHEFKVLPTAADTMSKLKLGRQITLLLTEDNQVAGAVEAGAGNAAGNAVGVVKTVSTSSVTIDLLCGISITGATSLSAIEVSKLQNQLATVTSLSKGLIAVSRLSGGVTGDLDVAAKKLGEKTLADNAVIYQSTSDGAKAINLSQIPSARIPSSGILYARTNWAGKIDLLVISNVTGSDYQFGRLSFTEGYEEQTVDKDGKVTTTKHGGSVSIIMGATSIGPFPASFSLDEGVEIHDGDYVGVKLNNQGAGIDKIVLLTKLGSIANSAWSGATSVTAGGRSYTVPSNVLCFNEANRTWITLDQAHAFATTSDIYVDTTGFVRIVEVR